MTPLQHDINDLTTFMQSAVFESLDDCTKAALERKKTMLCAEYVIGIARTLHRNKFKGCYAPHKAVMLIAIMRLAERGHWRNNVIVLDDELKAEFKKVWGESVPYGSPFKCEYRNPFTHMDSEEFWDLSGDKNKAFIAQEAFYAFTRAESRRIIEAFLKSTIVNDTVSTEYRTEHPSLRMVAEDLLTVIPALPLLGMMMVG